MKESESHKEFLDEATPAETNELHRCEACSEEYGQPLLAENLSGPSPEEYCACPRCLSKVEETVATKSRAIVEEEPAAEEELTCEEIEEAPTIPAGKIEVNIDTSCQHELGYLKKREKGSPIPDECLICTKMIDCM